MKFLSLISNTKEQQLREEYSKIVAQHYLNGVRTPNSEEIKGLQKLLLEVAAMSPEVEENKAKRWFKKATLGESFTTAGFWGARDLLKRTLGRVKNFFAGGILASTLFVTSCAPGAPTQTTQQEHTLEEYENLTEEETFIFDEEFLAKISPEEKNVGKHTYVRVPYQNLMTFQTNYKIVSREKHKDEFGEYSIVRIEIPDEYIERMPIPNINGFTEEELRGALKFYTDYALNEFLDSPVLDTPERWNEWWEGTGQHFFASDGVFGGSVKTMVEQSAIPFDPNNPLDSPDSHAPVVYNNHGWLPLSNDGETFIERVPLIRDGGSRTMNRQVYGVQIINKIADNAIHVSGVAAAGYVTDFTLHESAMRKVYGTSFDFPDSIKYGEYEHHYWTEVLVDLLLVLEDGQWKIGGWGYNYGAANVGPTNSTTETIIRGNWSGIVDKKLPGFRY